MINKLKTHQNMTLKDLESISGGAVPWAAISVGIAAAKLTYDPLVKLITTSHTNNKSLYHNDISKILRMITYERYKKSNKRYY